MDWWIDDDFSKNGWNNIFIYKNIFIKQFKNMIMKGHFKIMSVKYVSMF